MEFVVIETLSTLRLNAVNLSVHEAKLYDTTISNTTQMTLDVLPSSDLIGLTAQFNVGQTYITIINYEGQLRTEKNGFYYVAYPGENGQQKSLIATVFEPNYARQMLPCLDDLHFKAQFSLSVIAPKELTVFFNTMEMSVEHDESNQLIVFETTPPMSTYLLALVIGEYRTTIVRAASTVEQSRYLQRAAEIGAQSVDLMEQITGLSFSMKKLGLSIELTGI
ncbi:Aminopeptidase N-like [Aphelenchoides besseyi]|nr:Aminopeptidase N-like [Aphelenchoides besseyi]